MKFYGPVYMNRCKIITTNNYYNSDNKEEEKEKADESDDSDHSEVVEVKPVPASNAPINQPCEQSEDEHFTFDAYIAEKETAHILRQWLHLMMDPIPSKKPKEKLIYLRAVSEAKVFTQKLPYKVYLSEFEMVSSNSYYVWMHRELKYDRDDIDVIIEQYQNYLAQFSK
jgi:hypothetical protein